MGQDVSINNSFIVSSHSTTCSLLLDPPPEIIIDKSLALYSGLNSTAILQGHMSMVDVNQRPAYTEKLGSALGGLESVPNAVGLGALVIAMILEVLIGKQDQMSTGDILHRVFAGEEASEIRDLMDEYMRRLRINLRNSQLQLEDTWRIEAMLSTQLTRLKNSMLHDGHISHQALSQWVNGAAFHTQMLIHQAHLGGGDGNRATAAVDLYQQDLNLLNDNLEREFYLYLWEPACYDKYIRSNTVLGGPMQYFSSTKRDIKALIKQRNTFNVVVSQ